MNMARMLGRVPTVERLAPWVTAGLIGLALVGCAEESGSPGIGGGSPDDLPMDATSDGGAPVDADRPDRVVPVADRDASAPVFREAERPSVLLEETIHQFRGTAALYGENVVTGGVVAYNADAPMLAGPIGRILPAIAYAAQVTAGDIDPATEIVYRPEFLRTSAGPLGEDHIGDTYTLAQLVELTVVRSDPSAEALLVSAIGGSPTVDRIVESTGIEGLGRYLSPCELDRALTRHLDPRFAGVDCPELAKWIRDDDPSGMVPAPFSTFPEFDDETIALAWRAIIDAREHTATARAWGTVLARLAARSLIDPATNDIVRGLLDRGLGAGGGGDLLPPSAWVGNLEGRIHNGRHWIGLASRSGPPTALVLLTSGHTITNPGPFFARSALLIFEQLVGAVDHSTPTPNGPVPEWLRGVFLVEAEESGHCNDEFRDDFDGLLACRQAAARSGFTVDESSAGALLIRDGPLVDATWFWTEPNQTRHRYQVRLDPGGWWAWARSYRVHVTGSWRLDVYLNGQPALVAPFEVTE